MTPAAIELRHVVDDADIATVRSLFREYAKAIGTDLEYQGFAAELARLPEPYVPPRGALLIARVDNAVAGCVALRPFDEGSAEMKRLYVRSDYRGCGLGRRLVDAVIAAARAGGYRALRLDTLASMSAAQALYRELGFVEIPPYGKAWLPGMRFFSLALGDAGAS